jgi:xyloglucan-specific exo-beta-1,4-glucanase
MFNLRVFGLSLAVLAGASSQSLALDVTWSEVPLGGGGYFTGIHFSSSQNGLMYLRSDVAGPWRRTAASLPWSPLKDSAFNPTLIRGGITTSGCGALAVHPTLSNVVYAEMNDITANPVGGLHKSTDGGLTWNVTRTAYADANYIAGTGARKYGQAITIDPQNPEVVYYGTLRNGLYRTLNGGTNWSTMLPHYGNLPDGSRTWMRSVAVDAKSTLVAGRSSIIYTSIYGLGVVRSTNGGDTWSSLTDAFNAGFLALRPAGTESQNISITSMVVGEDRALYVGHSYGLAKFTPGAGTAGTWSQITIPGAKANSSVSFIALAKNPTPGNTTPRLAILGARDVESNPWTVFRSPDGGASWLAPLHPASPSSVLTVTSRAPWQGSAGWLFQAPSMISLNPFAEDEAYVLDAFSVWKCTNFWATTGTATNWSNDVTGAENIVPITMMSAAASTTGRAAPLYTGCSDIVGFRYDSLTTPATTADRVQAGDGREYVTGYDFMETNPDFVWAVKHRNIANASGDLSGITLRSTNGGETWSATKINPYATTESYSGAKIAVSANNSDNVVIIPGNYNDDNKNAVNLPAKYTLDGGASWNIAKKSGTSGDNLPPFFTGASGNTAYRAARFLVSDRVTGGTFYAYDGGPGKIWRSTDGGATWTLLPGLLAQWGLGDTISPPQIAAAPGRAGELWAGISGAGIFRSTNGGETWQRVSFFAAPGGVDNRASFVSFGKELPGSGADNPTVFVFTFPEGGTRPALYRCTNLKTAGTNTAALVWTLVKDWTYTGHQPYLLEADRQTYGRFFLGSVSFIAGQINESAPSLPQGTTLFSTQTPTAFGSDGVAYELGMRFVVSKPGSATAIRFYKGGALDVVPNGGQRIGRLWRVNNTTGTPLGTATFGAETASGWQEAALTTPVPLVSGESYVVSVNTYGHFGFTQDAFVSALSNPPLSSVAHSSVTPNGVYGPSGQFPASTFRASNYFRDLRFVPAPNPPTALAVTTIGSSALRLTWSDASGDETGFLIERGSNAAGWTPLATTAQNATAYTNGGLQPSTSYGYRLRAVNSFGASAALTATGATWSAIQDWRQQNFGSPAASGNAADTADPDKDGANNFLEYALGRSPLVAEPQAITTVSLNGTTTLSLTYLRARAELAYTVKTSTDLQTWSLQGVNQGNAPAGQTNTATLPFSGEPRRFLRLEISQP